MTCKNCSEPVEDAYCPKCGQKALLVPFTFASIRGWITDAFDVDKGLFKTFRLLLRKPDVLIHEFLSGRTKNVFNPVKYLLVIAAVLIALFWITDNFSSLHPTETEPSDERVLYTLSEEQTIYYAVFMISLPILIGNMIFFQKQKLTAMEHIIIVLYENTMFISVILIPVVVTDMFVIAERDETYFIPAIISVCVVATYHVFFTWKVFRCRFLVALLASGFTFTAGLYLAAYSIFYLEDEWHIMF